MSFFYVIIDCYIEASDLPLLLARSLWYETLQQCVTILQITLYECGLAKKERTVLIKYI